MLWSAVNPCGPRPSRRQSFHSALPINAAFDMHARNVRDPARRRFQRHSLSTWCQAWLPPVNLFTLIELRCEGWQARKHGNAAEAIAGRDRGRSKARCTAPILKNSVYGLDQHAAPLEQRPPM